MIVSLYFRDMSVDKIGIPIIPKFTQDYEVFRTPLTGPHQSKDHGKTMNSISINNNNNDTLFRQDKKLELHEVIFI